MHLRLIAASKNFFLDLIQKVDVFYGFCVRKETNIPMIKIRYKFPDHKKAFAKRKKQKSQHSYITLFFQYTLLTKQTISKIINQYSQVG